MSLLSLDLMFLIGYNQVSGGRGMARLHTADVRLSARGLNNPFFSNEVDPKFDNLPQIEGN